MQSMIRTEIPKSSPEQHPAVIHATLAIEYISGADMTHEAKSSLGWSSCTYTENIIPIIRPNTPPSPDTPIFLPPEPRNTKVTANMTIEKKIKKAV